MNQPTQSNQPNLWGLVLAGGEGKRLEDYVRQLRGECLPKQYMNFIGTRSMIEHTFARAERLIPRERLLAMKNSLNLRRDAPAQTNVPPLAARAPTHQALRPQNVLGPG